MTLLAVVLVATCLVGGAWATLTERIARRKIPQRRTRGAALSRGSRCAAPRTRGMEPRRFGAPTGPAEHSHVRVVKAPYDWEEHE